MGIDEHEKDFARFKPMLEEMLPEWEKHKSRQSERSTDDQPEVDADLRAAIHAPLHESEEQIAARAEQAKANDEIEAESDRYAEAERLKVEAEAGAAAKRTQESAEIDPAPTQKQGAGAPGAVAGGNPPENAGQAIPEPSLAEQAQTGTIATDQGSTAKPVG